MNRISKLYALACAAAFSALATTSYAVIDVADITDKVTEVETAVAVVGAAVLVMFAGIKVWKWIRSAM